MLDLPSVSLWCYATVFHKATYQALCRCVRKAFFAKIIVFTDQPREFASLDQCMTPVEIVKVPHFGAGDPSVETQVRRGADMVSVWMLTELPKYSSLFTEHALSIQWDSFIVNAEAWSSLWLKYDYIGAAWPDGVVGNNGFWLHSRRLIDAIGKLNLPKIPQACHPYDVRLSYEDCPPHPYYIRLPHGNTGLRGILEREHGMVWAPKEVADQFSVENREYKGSFGFHGVKTLASVARQGFYI